MSGGKSRKIGKGFSPSASGITFELPRADREALADFPWEAGLEAWPTRGVQAVQARRGESRHTVLFVEATGRRYAIKETAPDVARHEIRQLQEVRRRGIYALEPVGVVVAPGPLVPVGVVAGVTQYLPGDLGYCITRLAQRVIPQALLYRYPFTQANRHMLWNAIVALLVELHRRGIFWGDPSLANVLIDLSQHQVRALLADAETVEIFPGPLDERRCQQDLGALQESLLWPGEDIRQLRGGEAVPSPITEEDTAYIREHYAALRQARGWAQLQALGYAIRDPRWQREGPPDPQGPAPQLTPQAAAVPPLWGETARPRWYQERIQSLLGIAVPLQFARQFYSHLTTHQWLMCERTHREISLEDAARDWYEHHHLPAITLLSTYFPSESDSLEVYLGVLEHKWRLSLHAGFEVALEEAALDYALHHAREAPLLHRAFIAVSAVLPQRFPGRDAGATSELAQLVRKEEDEPRP
ncbi:MAG TPA: DUF4032 domain-containing protein [Ktedonobacterales bacterium]|jgi:hypothetical protein